MDASGFSPLTRLASAMLRILKKTSVWKDERPFYLLRSTDRMWLISLAITKWSRCIHRWSNPPIWRLPTRTTTCSPQWSLTIPRPFTVDRWRPSVYQWQLDSIDWCLYTWIWRQDYAIEGRIRASIDHWGLGWRRRWRWRFLDSHIYQSV